MEMWYSDDSKLKNYQPYFYSSWSIGYETTNNQ